MRCRYKEPERGAKEKKYRSVSRWSKGESPPGPGHPRNRLGQVTTQNSTASIRLADAPSYTRGKVGRGDLPNDRSTKLYQP